MSPLRPRLSVRWPGLLALALLGGCQVAGAKLWNLEQVHDPDGSPKRRGRIENDLEWLLTGMLERSNFGGEDYQVEQAKEKRIDDPQGVCLENLIELGECRADERVAAQQAAAYSWLGVECTYVLSRERCVLELAPLAKRLGGVADVALPAEGATVATPEEVKKLYDDLLNAVVASEKEPELAAAQLAEVCQRIDATALDRPGALRLVRATLKLLDRRENRAALRPVSKLRLSLAKRCVALTLVEARSDKEGMVRAAALQAGLHAFPDQRAELLRWALVEPMDGVAEREAVSLRALEFLERYGLPPAPAGEDAEGFEDKWIELLCQVLQATDDGPHTVATCKALARITGEPVNLRPEAWLVWWEREKGAAVEPSTGGEP